MIVDNVNGFVVKYAMGITLDRIKTHVSLQNYVDQRLLYKFERFYSSSVLCLCTPQIRLLSNYL